MAGFLHDIGGGNALMLVAELVQMANIMKEPVKLDLSLNELRIIVGCFRAVAYMAQRDDEPYLDPDGQELHAKLEELYRLKLEKNETEGSKQD
jgi:hypothetical protein